MNRPAVSVVMCTYNGSKYLEDQLNSIINQDYSIAELIIVDDNSTDNTWEMLQAYSRNYAWIHIYKNGENLGYNRNFEKAITLATGDLIAIADQDDIWMPKKISRLVAAFDSDDVVLAHNRSVRLENNRLRFKSAALHDHFHGNDTRKLFMFNQVNGHDMMFRKSLVEKFTPIPNNMMYDWWIAVTATVYGTIASIDEYLVHHRIHSNNSFFTKKAEVRKTEPDLEEALGMFATIEGLNRESRTFLITLVGLLSQHRDSAKGSFDHSLFKFLLKYRKIVFGHKRRLLPLLHQVKLAARYARFDFKGKGLSF